MPSSPRPTIDASAHCACGAVHLVAKGKVRSMLLCACRDCQQATGSGHASVAVVSEADVAVTGPVKGFSRTAESGATFIRHFCPECGTPLFGRSSRFAGAVMLPVGLFREQSAWFAPGQVIFARTLRSWDNVRPDLPLHDTYRMGE